MLGEVFFDGEVNEADNVGLSFTEDEPRIKNNFLARSILYQIVVTILYFNQFTFFGFFVILKM